MFMTFDQIHLNIPNQVYFLIHIQLAETIRKSGSSKTYAKNILQYGNRIASVRSETFIQIFIPFIHRDLIPHFIPTYYLFVFQNNSVTTCNIIYCIYTQYIIFFSLPDIPLEKQQTKTKFTHCIWKSLEKKKSEWQFRQIKCENQTEFSCWCEQSFRVKNVGKKEDVLTVYCLWHQHHISHL